MGERSYVSCVTAWFVFVPGAIYLALYSPWRHEEKWSAICLIWYWALLVEAIRFVVSWFLLLRTDWDKQVLLAKERSEALNNKKNKNCKTSPKTRALIAENDDDDDDERRSRND